MIEPSFHVHDGPSFERMRQPKLPSNRHFGFVIGGALSVLTLVPFDWLPPDWVLLSIALPLLVSALFLPRILWLPNLLWMKLGMLIGGIVNFISLSVLYFGALTIVGGIMKIIGVDRLNRQIEADTDSYWENHRRLDDPPSDMRRQS